MRYRGCGLDPIRLHCLCSIFVFRICKSQFVASAGCMYMHIWGTLSLCSTMIVQSGMVIKTSAL